MFLSFCSDNFFDPILISSSLGSLMEGRGFEAVTSWAAGAIQLSGIYENAVITTFTSIFFDLWTKYKILTKPCHANHVIFVNILNSLISTPELARWLQIVIKIYPRKNHQVNDFFWSLFWPLVANFPLEIYSAYTLQELNRTLVGAIDHEHMKERCKISQNSGMILLGEYFWTW